MWWNMIYGTLVKVITGFYIGCVGVVLDQAADYGSQIVELHCKVGGRVDVLKQEIYHNDMKVIKRPDWCATIEWEDKICRD